MDSKGNPNGELKFNAAGANKALENIGKHINVNAFKAMDDDSVPIDLNWIVTIVGVKSNSSKEDYDRREKCIEHIL